MQLGFWVAFKRTSGRTSLEKKKNKNGGRVGGGSSQPFEREREREEDDQLLGISFLSF